MDNMYICIKLISMDMTHKMIVSLQRWHSSSSSSSNISSNISGGSYSIDQLFYFLFLDKWMIFNTNNLGN